MSDSDKLLKAAINRIAARLAEKMINSAQELTEIAEEMPNKLKEEWSNFKEEVIEESERLEKEAKKTKTSDDNNSNKKIKNEDLIQIKIDQLRSKVIELNKNIEEKN